VTNWQDRIIGEGHEAPDQILANPYNFRIHSQFQQASLTGVLETIGWVQRIIINQRSGHLIDGHLRVTLADRYDQPYVPVSYVDLSDDEERLVLATLDPLSALAVHDKAQYESLLRDVHTDNAAIAALLADTAEKMGMLWDSLGAPDEFAEYGEDIETEHRCPQCGYEWSGKSS
jgi:ParB-like chromosome segregation protein Spo0J